MGATSSSPQAQVSSEPVVRPMVPSGTYLRDIPSYQETQRSTYIQSSANYWNFDSGYIWEDDQLLPQNFQQQQQSSSSASGSRLVTVPEARPQPVIQTSTLAPEPVPALTTSKQQSPPQKESLPLSNNLANQKVTCCPFKKGDKIKVIAIAVNELRSLANGKREWDTVQCLNKTGIINGINDNCQVNVEFDDSQIVWTFDTESTVEHSVSDTVKLIDSEDQVRKLQHGHGEFVPDMKHFLGKRGIICKVFSDGDLSVIFDGGAWTLNPKCVINLFRKPKRSQILTKSLTKGKKKSPPRKKKSPDTSKIGPSNVISFTIGDRVKVKAIRFDQLKDLQKGHGGWNPRMAQTINKTGIVIGIKESQDVTVLFDQTRFCWTFNPDALRKNYAGDIVKIIRDKITMKKILDENGKYSREIMNFLGECGIIMDTDNDGDLIISSGKNTWILNPSCVMNLSELAKSRQKMKQTKPIESKQDEMTWRKWIGQFIDDDSQVITKTRKKRLSIKDTSDSNITHLIEKIRSLEKEISKMEDANTCGICLENPKNVIFLCGHGVCSVCSNNLSVCHMCRKYLTYKIPVY